MRKALVSKNIFEIKHIKRAMFPPNSMGNVMLSLEVGVFKIHTHFREKQWRCKAVQTGLIMNLKAKPMKAFPKMFCSSSIVTSC